MSRARPGLAGLVMLLVALGLTVAVAPQSASASGPIFTVMNTSETPPDGVYFRYSPNMSDTDRDYGWGVFMNEQVQLECYAWGQAVGAYNNTLWYWVLNVSRPTNYDGRSNQGMLNAHYINDGLAANQIDAGVPACVNNRPPIAPPPPSTGAVVYYSPYPAGQRLPGTSGAVYPLLSLPWGTWNNGPGSCSVTNTANNTPSSVSGRIVSTLGGWSKGRVGSLYELEHLNGTSGLSRIKYVLLIDPGGYYELKGSCDSSIGGMFATWLQKTPGARLVILSGPVTLDYADPINGHASAGIQNFYFNAVRAKGVSSQVLVCNYTDPTESVSASHNTIYNNSSYLLRRPILTSCPSISGMTYKGYWHP